MKSDIEIARSIELTKIKQVAANFGMPLEYVTHYGRYMAKVSEEIIDEEKVKNSNLILVTAITPTKAGIGKTTVSIGLALGLNKIGKKAICALREPSLGPCFGMKGGAAGGGYAQVLPMEKINLHFTGDFHAITSAHNMIAALLDNYMYQNQDNGFAMKEVLWNRVLDVNDRGLRYIVTGLGGKTNGITRESSFDITPASEIMAILCLAKDEADLRRRIENILLGFTIDNKPFTVKDLGVAGAITVLLKDALSPNLVQTTEATPAFVHGGPFANIAHGCNSVLATKLAMTFGDYVITEAGFGADLGAEKFYDIKCRKAGLQPKLTVIVATAQGLKMHGGVEIDKIKEPNLEGLREGVKNLDKHIENLQSFGQTVVVAFNRYANDTEEEINFVRQHCEEMGVGFAVNNAFAEGGAGAVELANLVVDTIENKPSAPLSFAYDEEDSVEVKVTKVACELYGAKQVLFGPAARKKLKMIEELGFSHFPICIAKTQYSFSTDPKLYGVASGFNFAVRDIVINAGAEMLVIVAGEMMRMPGLPKEPQALHIDIVNGEIEGLS
ncbi:Formate--tetrahydrofolate ligase [uncultured Bacteroides sp.]|uniref:formate--tetrahydrofolate ligase n=1 Tax=Bacteroides TaxID=816 RepID=UPI000821CA24|nr:MULTISPECIES: formate--tetrahydrofolate ligase [Bacteroides]MCF2737240.1 formate--tetrahydrofolate ligase [Bacteroides caecigallinarum]MCR8894985.1 formate--tetrahydrofolate ligase [Bacteroides sp. ET336]MCU6770174.1 formate--tetrahydrofolate ligase [Bacteroides cellulolyticus]MDN0052931.1 formate--tetrahydrofolate ligase [Bacteroides caecigallinarum]MDN0059481.1 formate--tetrahydrofolate ligase [Bacteroides caecigallinarum]